MSTEDSFHCHQFSTSIDWDSSFTIRLPSKSGPLSRLCYLISTNLKLSDAESPFWRPPLPSWAGSLPFPSMTALNFPRGGKKWPAGCMNGYSALSLTSEQRATEARVLTHTHTPHTGHAVAHACAQKSCVSPLMHGLAEYCRLEHLMSTFAFSLPLLSFLKMLQCLEFNSTKIEGGKKDLLRSTLWSC